MWKVRIGQMAIQSGSWGRSRSPAALLRSAGILAAFFASPAGAFRDAPDLLRDAGTLRLQARAVIEGRALSLLPSTAAARVETRAWESPSHREASGPLEARIRGVEVRNGLRRE